MPVVHTNSGGKAQIFADLTADFRRFNPCPGNSSTWRAQIFAESRRFSQKTEIFADFRRKPQIGLRHLRFSSALPLSAENSLINLVRRRLLN